jgi:hypothetical protein
VIRATLAVLLAAMLPSAAGPRSEGAGRRAQDAAQTATCVFTNETYSGKCVETAEIPSGATPQQACESILRCLNDVGCVKTYCRATEIRSGWRLESATAK